MTVTAPPRPPRPSDPVDREELEALVEALIEEARQRARRRRRIYAASAALVALVVVAVSSVVDRTTQPDTASPALAARSSGLAGAATPKIAFIREPAYMGYAGVLWVMNRDGRGQRRLAPAFGGMRWSPDGQKIAFAAWSDVEPEPDERRLRHERGREREGEADERPRLGKRSGLVARRTEDRVRPWSSGVTPRSTS